MELVVFMGLQATGKSSFFKQRFFQTHVRINLDMLKTRYREQLLFTACLEGKAKTVVDNSNLTKSFRARYIQPARERGFSVSGYFFQSVVADAVARNANRCIEERVPDLAILGGAKSLELPSSEEGFDALYFVRMAAGETFTVEEWRNEF
jgi:predicted kinase